MTVVVTHTTPADSSFSTEGAAAWNANHTLTGVGTMAEQDADNVAVTGGSINGTTIGNVTPNAGTFTTLTANSTAQFGRGSANYIQATGNSAGNTPEISSLGSDANIPMTIESKGTGAINFSAGSRGVNISNGGTVTAITRTAAGGPYTSFPSIAISAPTTAGGVQATASVTGMTFYGSNPQAINSPGSGYTVNDTLTIVGGTGTPCTLRVTAVDGSGGVTAAAHLNFNNYTVLPAVPYSVTGGTGSGATFTSGWQVNAQSITNAGSGYVEQPTVTFSGGGGSGAAAYATVGSISRLTSVGSGLELAAASGIGFRVANSGTANVNYYSAQGNSSGGSTLLAATGSDTDISAALSSKGAGSVRLQTNNSAQEQLRVAHTASAVNYVQVTGATTGNGPAISVQGSDTNVNMFYLTKGVGSHVFYTNAGVSGRQLDILHAANAVNRMTITGSAANSAPTVSVAGTDTNIDLALTPKGTGLVRFGTYTNTALAIAGYIEIKDSGGTVRRLAVVA